VLRRGLEKLRRPPLVLNYHGLGDIPRELDPSNLFVQPERFRKQLRSLIDRGYEFVKVSEFVDRLRAGTAPAGLCAITFDDGTLDNLEILPGILAELGVPATLFVCPGLLGLPHPDLDSAAGVRLMSADELREVAALDGIEVGSHTRMHQLLGNADEEAAYEEMAASKRDLVELIGEPVLSFAYPSGAYSPDCPGAAQRAGYKAAVACGLRGDWHPHELYRESIGSLDGGFVFALKSRGMWRAVRLSPPGRLAARLTPGRHHVPDIGWRRTREGSETLSRS
jgi:peptidoglycan/xylan/chitin deacetylase (PgdA/CDA1 family)